LGYTFEASTSDLGDENNEIDHLLGLSGHQASASFPAEASNRGPSMLPAIAAEICGSISVIKTLLPPGAPPLTLMTVIS
jgi:hypothetical protein